jgi:sarcosine oxidase gamma subunit
MDTVSDPTIALAPPQDDVTSLLPGPDAVMAQLTARLAAVDDAPCCLVVLRLHRPDDAATSGLAAATSIVARSVRGDDWLGHTGPDEFALLLGGGLGGAMTAAARVVGAVSALGSTGLGVCAGVTVLEAGLPAREVLRRAHAGLTAAAAAGTGAVCVS